MCGFDLIKFVDLLPLAEFFVISQSQRMGVVCLLPVILAAQSDKWSSVVEKIHGLFLVKNPGIRWRPLDREQIIKQLYASNSKYSLRECLKDLRKALTVPVVKGGNKRKNYNLQTIVLMAHEELCRINGFEPTAESVLQMAAGLCKKYRVFTYETNEFTYHRMQEFMRCLITRLMDASGGQIYNNDNLMPSRDWLTNNDIDSCLDSLIHMNVGKKIIRYIPAWLITSMPKFKESVDNAVSKKEKNTLIIFIVNTAHVLPGEHWFLVAYDSAIPTIVYYDSGNRRLNEYAINILEELSIKYKISINFPMISAQMGSSECGVYSLYKALCLMRDDHETLMYSVITDDELYRYRRLFQDLINDN